MTASEEYMRRDTESFLEENRCVALWRFTPWNDFAPVAYVPPPAYVASPDTRTPEEIAFQQSVARSFIRNRRYEDGFEP